MRQNNRAKTTVSMIGIIIVLVFVLSGCKPSWMSDEYYNICVDAINIADDYLDNNITQEDARNVLDSIRSDLEKEAKNLGNIEDDTYMVIIDSNVLNLSIYVSLGSRSGVREARASLAEKINY